MALKEIKARLVAVVGTADPTAKVYGRMRNLSTDANQAELTGSDGKIHFWMVRREMTALTDLTIDDKLTQQDDVIVLEGFYGMNDAANSEESFDVVLDAVLQAVNVDRRPVNSGGTALNGTVRTAQTPQIRKMDFAAYGPSQVLCHHAEIVMKVTPAYLQ